MSGSHRPLLGQSTHPCGTRLSWEPSLALGSSVRGSDDSRQGRPEDKQDSRWWVRTRVGEDGHCEVLEEQPRRGGRGRGQPHAVPSPAAELTMLDQPPTLISIVKDRAA